MKHKCFYLLSEYKAACGNTLISSDDNHLTIYIVSYFERAKRRIHSLHWQMLSGLWFSHWRRLIYTNVFIHTSKTGGLTAQASNAETVRSVASSGVGRCEEKKNHWSKGVTEAELPQQKGFFLGGRINCIKPHLPVWTWRCFGRAELSPWSSQVTKTPNSALHDCPTKCR